MHDAEYPPQASLPDGPTIATGDWEGAQLHSRYSTQYMRAQGRGGKCGCQSCFWCGAHLSTRHEHDHFPTPAGAGGTQSVPSCLTCHDLKDRIPMKDWPMAALSEAMRGLSSHPAAMLFLAKAIADHLRIESNGFEHICVTWLRSLLPYVERCEDTAEALDQAEEYLAQIDRRNERLADEAEAGEP